MFNWIKNDVMANSYLRRAVFFSSHSSATSWDVFQKSHIVKTFFLNILLQIFQIPHNFFDKTFKLLK